MSGESRRGAQSWKKLARGWLFVLCLCSSSLLAGCGAEQTAGHAPVSNVEQISNTQQTSDRSAGVNSSTPEQPGRTANQNSTDAAGDFLITSRGIGRVRLGMSFGELKKLFPGAKFHLATVRPDETADVAVGVGGKDVLFVRTRRMDETTADELPADDDPIRSLMTSDARHATAAGVRPGSPVEDAVKAYGTPELFFQPPTEFAAFKPQEVSNLSFHLAGADGKEPAGVYSMKKEDMEDGWHKSDRVRPGARITFIAVIDMTSK
ncbi:MAG TPA: hypothetical protein VGB73_09915 [Pyrinomonadaceae bacterium]|jgi:hypothetical protein